MAPSNAQGRVVFVGAGPGAADLLTFRAARAIAEADVVIWAASLVHPDVLEHARDGAEIVDSARLPMEGVLPYYERAVAEGLTIARIHSGDPALWGSSTAARRWAWTPRSSPACPASAPSRRWWSAS
jgi:precorrin-4/cobalt-precorrin-4 C11-methyltransferase